MSLSLNENLCHAQHSLLLIIDIQERLVELNPIIWLDSTINYHIWDSDVKGIPNEGAAIKFVLKHAYL